MMWSEQEGKGGDGAMRLEGDGHPWTDWLRHFLEGHLCLMSLQINDCDLRFQINRTYLNQAPT